jgi:cytoskeleton protein RodZ
MAERSSGDFGRSLREARERRGISLRQIASTTKIGLTALEALERNDISRLPGGIFTRGIVRSYALEVGLDPDAAIQDFFAQFPNDSVAAGLPPTAKSEDHQAVESERLAATAFLRLIAVSVPIAIALAYLGSRERRVEPSPPQVAQPAAGTAAAASAAAADAAPAPTTAADAAPAPLPEPVLSPGPVTPAAARSAAGTRALATTGTPATAGTSAAAAGPPVADSIAVLKVSLSALRDCWVYAEVDGGREFQRLLHAGDQQTLEARRELLLTLGNAAAVVVTLNGSPARPFGPEGRVVTTRLNMTNFKEYLANP